MRFKLLLIGLILLMSSCAQVDTNSDLLPSDIEDLENTAAAGVGMSSWTAQSEAIAGSDLLGITDVSDTTQSDNGSSKKATFTQVGTFMATLFEPIKGADDNFVTDAQLVVIGNTSGTNTGNQTATTVSFTPFSSIAATTTQAAIEEVFNEAAGGSMIYPGAGIPLSTGAAWGTSYTLSTLAQGLPGADIAPLLTGQSISPASISVQATALPTLSFSDSNSGNTNQTIATVTANATTTTAGAVTSEIVISNQVGGGDGVFHEVAKFSGGDGISYIYDPLSAGIKEPHAAKTAAYTIGSSNWRECYGGTIKVAAATTMTMCASPVYGMNFTVKVKGAYVVSVDPQAADYQELNGTDLVVGDKATSNGSTGSAIHCKHNGTYWDCLGVNIDGTLWVDGN